MNSGFKLQDGGRIDVETFNEGRRVKVIISQFDAPDLSFYVTLSEARGISSALMGAAAEA